MNFDRWKHLRDDHTPPHCMDWRHVCMINAMLRHELPKSIVSIGCFRGFSDSAVFEAMEEFKEIETADFYDPDMQSDMVERHNPPRFTIHKARSSTCAVAGKCWLIDGDHGVGAVHDYQMAIAAKAEIIVIHDTHSCYTLGGHAGARDIGAYLQMDAPHMFLDARPRLCEMTQRGLLFGFFQKPNPKTIEALEALQTEPLEQLMGLTNS